MNDIRPSQALPTRLWRRIPVVVRATLIALLILNIGQLPPALALWLNLKLMPQLPLFLLFTGLWLWLFWRYLDGHGWPRSSTKQRRQDLRATSLSGTVWTWSLLAGGLGFAAVMSLAVLTGRVADLPQEAYRTPFDLAVYPWWTVLAFFISLAGTAGVVEEAAFRGYMLSQVQRRHGWWIAIALVAALFYVVHLSHAYATVAFLPFFAAYSLLHGALVYLTRSILPSVVLHCIGDFCILPMQYGVIPLPLGQDYQPYLVAMLLFAAGAVPAFVMLRKAAIAAQAESVGSERVGQDAPSFRQATTHDKSFCRDLHWRTMRAYVEATWGWDDADQAQRFEAGFHPSRTEIIEDRGQPIGMLVVDRASDPVRLLSIELSPEHQNRGLGSAIIRQIIREAGGRSVWLQVLKVNPAKQLYERLGFVTIEQTETHWQMLRGPD